MMELFWDADDMAELQKNTTSAVDIYNTIICVSAW